MKLTQEQEEIIQSTGDLKINAVAGSGKTTTVIAYAKSRPASSKILYLAFNKSVKLEAVRKFAEQGLHNVQVETAHSLAYRHIVYRHQYKVRPQGYKTNEIAELLHLRGNGEKHTEYIMANHINKLVAYFCNSDKPKIKDLNYIDTLTDPKAIGFVTSLYEYIAAQARLLLSKMDKGEIDITHDFYLKKFQLSNPKLPYDYILFDEGQDASPAMLDVFFRQDATKVIVGDTHQQIYGWRYAVNSLEKASFATLHLSTSFRFPQEVANLAMKVLQLKKHLCTHHAIPIIGIGNNKESRSKAVLARTNLGLLLNAIEYVTAKQNVQNIYFEGNINSYTYADEGASLYDVLNLHNGKYYMIRDKLIKSMKDLGELEEYIEKTEDVQLSIMVEIVRTYGNEIPKLIKELKSKHVSDEDKQKAEMIFSTVHRAKGMEYDTIYLVNDFITEEKLVKSKEDPTATVPNTTKLNEEVNLLYVAVTRAKHSIHIPESLLPPDFPPSPHIYVIPEQTDAAVQQQQTVGAPLLQGNSKNIPSSHKAYSVAEVRSSFREAYRPWTAEQDQTLKEMHLAGRDATEIATHFGRTIGAINSRIRKLHFD